jgi:hypothetical protein
VAETVTIEDELAARVREEADRQFSGKLDALVHDALERYLPVQAGIQRLQELAGGSAADEPARLAQAVAAAGVSTSHLEAVADTLRQAAGLAPGFREPGSPQQHIEHFIDHAAASDSNAVSCGLVIAQAAAGAEGQQADAIVSYARGTLRDSRPGLSGELDQYFSDRTGPNASHFDPAQSERLGMSAAIDPTSGLVTLELIARAWGDARQQLGNLRMEAGVLVADGASVGNQAASALYLFSLATITIPG